MNNRLIKSNDAGGGGACTNTVDLYNPFPDGGGVALYQLNGNATDVSGNHNGTWIGTEAYGTGVFGQSGVFNGSSYINTGINLNSNSASVSCWVKITDGTKENFLGVLEGSNRLYFGVRESNFHLGAGGTQKYTVSAANLLDGNWHHIVYSLNGSLAVYYLDGQVADSTSYSGGGAFTLNAFIGALNNSGTSDNKTNGSIDQVRIFNRALRPYEVEALYTEEYCTPTIVPSEHFNTVLYEGNGGTKAITGVGFQPDLIWIKNRVRNNSHAISDVNRGFNKMLSSDRTDAESLFFGTGQTIQNLSSDGFEVYTPNPGYGEINYTGDDFVSWNFKAGGAAVLNEQGDIDSYVSANTEAGFSVVSYTGNGVSGATIGHGLNDEPKIFIVKRRDLDRSWHVLGSVVGLDKYLLLDTTDALASAAGYFPLPNNTTINYGTPSSSVNVLNGTFIAYCFAEVEGFSNFGSYVGTGASGNTVVTGFEPAFVMIKGTSLASQWNILDNKRDTTNPATHRLFANLSNAESTGINALSFLENGFEINNSDAGFNGSGQSYVYMAFAADPTTIEPSLEDSFNTVTYTGNGTSASTTQDITDVGFQADLIWIKNRDTSTAASHYLVDTVRGNGTYTYLNLIPDTTSAEKDATQSGIDNSTIDSEGFTLIGAGPRVNINNDRYVAWNWKGAELPAINSNGSIPSVVSANPAAGFSIVSYNSNGTAGSTIGHGLEAEPKMIIVKNRDDADKWAVYHNSIGATDFLALNETAAAVSSSAYWNNTSPNSNVFTIGATSPVNSPNNENYIAYCFAEVAGFSKFGSYTGVSGGVTVNVGFEPAFVMVKCTNNAEAWAIIDNKRTSPAALFPTSSQAEATSSGFTFTFTSTGFSFPDQAIADAILNQDGYEYIYMAFANQF